MHQYYSDMGNSKITLYQGDCLEYFSQVPTGSVDLIVTDPPYQIDNTKAGGKSRLCKRIQSAQNELTGSNLTEGFDKKILDEMLRVCKAPNLYIWCNGKQIPMYLDYFVKEHGCTFDILIWAKTNAVPAFNNKYLTDKEYCLYFRRGGYCQPMDYERARTVWFQPINKQDKDQWGHPTIKPLNIIQALVANSSKEGDTVLDCFMGSGTTGVACAKLHRDFIGMELNADYYNIAEYRIKDELQPMLF